LLVNYEIENEFVINIIDEEIPLIENLNFEKKKISYIFNNLIGIKEKELNVTYDEFKIFLNTYNNLNLSYRLNEFEKEKIFKINEIFKFIKIDKNISIQFKYENFIFIISKYNIYSHLCIVNSKKQNIRNKILKFLIYNKKFDKLFDMVEKYYLTIQIW
jgi:hypothetical protein